MGRKNDKRTRRAVAFYKVHYGFREPYKVRLAIQAATNCSLGCRGGDAPQRSLRLPWPT